MDQRPREDYRPGWYRWLERSFDASMHAVAGLMWLWGLGIFLLVLWGIWLVFISPAFQAP